MNVYGMRISRMEAIRKLAKGIDQYAKGPSPSFAESDISRETFRMWWDSWVKPRYEMIEKLAKGEELSWVEQEVLSLMIRED